MKEEEEEQEGEEEEEEQKEQEGHGGQQDVGRYTINTELHFLEAVFLWREGETDGGGGS